MTPRELQKYEVLFSPFVLFFLILTWLAGDLSDHERVRFKSYFTNYLSTARSAAEGIEISFHNEIYFHEYAC